MNKYEMLCESLQAAEESLSDILAQHRAEVAHYGDSWPGALRDIEDATKLVEDLKRKCEKEWIRLGRPTFVAETDIPY